MSKMTQRRITRRAARKINVQRRALRRAELREGWLSSNLGAALSKLEVLQAENTTLRAKVAA